MTGLYADIHSQSGSDRRFDAATPQAIGELVDLLADPDSDDARIEHTGRSGAGGAGGSDHVLYVAVRDGLAYLRYEGPVSGAPNVLDPVVPVGSLESGGTRSKRGVRYPASTGLELAHFTEALHEFARTSELPTCVQWVREADLDSGKPAPVARA